ncbi:hypothetical protein LDDCCGHA_0478 [Methylobacterium oxalidis]|nr:hypothetical protein LDDCCGHA_0478 [Methylobacterium oxalidis]
MPTVPTSSNGHDGRTYREIADGLWRGMLQRTVHTFDGHAAGRVVRIGAVSDDSREMAVIRLRSVMGGGEIALPVDRLARRNGHLIVKVDRLAVRSLARIGKPERDRPR